MRKHITPSVVISLIALTLSIMGAGYAAITLPRDSVGRAQIKSGAVGSPEVADGSLQPVDFSKAALAKLTGAAGPKGDAGDRGEAGPAGAAGAGGSGGGTGLNVIGGDGTVVGTFVAWEEGGVRMLTIRMANGTLASYWPNFGSTWDRADHGPIALSLAADCAEPRFTFPAQANFFFNDGVAWFSRSLNWAYTIGTERIAPADGTQLYGDFGAGCAPWDTVGSSPTLSEGFIRLEPTAVPPVLHTPVRLG